MSTEFTPLTETELSVVKQHLDSDTASLALKLHGRRDVDGKRIIQQITARQKAKNKLPDWYANPELHFPPPVSVEQASSQATAAYKASLVGGHFLADLTLGMGVDSLYFSRRFEKVFGYELNRELAAITARNLTRMGVQNVEVINDSGEEIGQTNLDCIYVDPSRRDSQKKKTVAFEDSSPNLIALLPKLTALAARLMVKSSPLIDIDLAVSQLRWVTEVHVTGYQKECKEVIFLLDPALPDLHPLIHAVILNEQGDPIRKMTFTRSQENGLSLSYADPTGYLYEPHAAFMKAGGFNLISEKYRVHKIAPNSHLYSSEEIRTDFPGRLFKITGMVNASKFSWRHWLRENKANLTLRNFPGNPDDLRKKWRLKEGGQDYLFATTLSSNRKVVIITEKVAL